MLDAIFRILALTRKELLAILKDPRSRFSLILPPILQCLIYGYVATYDLNQVPYAERCFPATAGPLGGVGGFPPCS
jgi:ABC-2 type transport system permease protein